MEAFTVITVPTLETIVLNRECIPSFLLIVLSFICILRNLQLLQTRKRVRIEQKIISTYG